MNTKKLIYLLKYAAIFGNIIFVLWISFNAMDEGFNGTLIEKLSAIGLIFLLVINSYLIIKNSKTEVYESV